MTIWPRLGRELLPGVKGQTFPQVNWLLCPALLFIRLALLVLLVLLVLVLLVLVLVLVLVQQQLLGVLPPQLWVWVTRGIPKQTWLHTDSALLGLLLPPPNLHLPMQILWLQAALPLLLGISSPVLLLARPLALSRVLPAFMQGRRLGQRIVNSRQSNELLNRLLRKAVLATSCNRCARRIRPS
jgi:hypothetical protein